MKKNKKREETIEQLEKKENIATIIIKVVTFIVIADIVYWAAAVFSNGLAIKHITIFLLVLISCACVMKVCSDIIDKALKQISLKEKELKVIKIKEMARKGILKDSVIVKDEDAINTVISANIATIVANGTNLIVEIFAGNDIKTVKIPIESIKKRLDDEAKEKILNKNITSIKIENLEEEIMRVVISGIGFTNENTQATDDDLLKMFELKE